MPIDRFNLFGQRDVFKSAREELLGLGARTKGLWFSDGDFRRPHILEDALHADGYFDSTRLFSDAYVLNQIAAGLFGLLTKGRNANTKNINRVVGFTEFQALTFALARIIAQSKNAPCCWSNVCSTDGSVFECEGLKIESGEHVILCLPVLDENVKDVDDLAQAVSTAGAVVEQYVLVPVNFGSKKIHNGREILSMIHQRIGRWSSAECPLCKDGSKALALETDPQIWKTLTEVLPKEKLRKDSAKA